ncbi:hypothetical protein H4Q26_006199 [Puccinia striiformis f. sp. tritici PST-130]|nr:hypothetical protein H4Q26_006199 [Puccinia striiformis f. sp. tritici PST-130]
MLSFHLLLVVFAMVCRGAIACRAGAMRACPGDSHVGVVYIPSQSKCSFGFAACCPPNVFKGSVETWPKPTVQGNQGCTKE